jgi:hypothetical protein
VTDDGLGTNTLSLAGADAALFQINGGNLELIPGAVLDAATNPFLDVAVQVDDAAILGSPDDLAGTTIVVVDINQPPTVRLVPLVTTLDESVNTGSPIVVATIQIIDDALGTATLALSGPDAAMFQISGGNLELIAGATLNAASNPLLEVTVSVDDTSIPGSPDDTAFLSLNVFDTIAPAPDTQPPDDTQDTTDQTDTDLPSVDDIAPPQSQGGVGQPSTSQGSANTIDHSAVPSAQMGGQLAATLFSLADDVSVSQFGATHWVLETTTSMFDRVGDPNSAAYLAIDLSFLTEPSLLWNYLDQLDRSLTNNFDFSGVVIGSVSAVTSGLTVGYVVWLLRGGALMSTLLAQLPAWKYMDPMVILAHFDDQEDGEDLGSLQSIVDQDFEDAYGIGADFDRADHVAEEAGEKTGGVELLT